MPCYTKSLDWRSGDSYLFIGINTFVNNATIEFLMICHFLKPVVNINAETANVKLFLLHNLHLCETAYTRVHLGRTAVNLTFHLSYKKD